MSRSRQFLPCSFHLLLVFSLLSCSSNLLISFSIPPSLQTSSATKFKAIKLYPCTSSNSIPPHVISASKSKSSTTSVQQHYRFLKENKIKKERIWERKRRKESAQMERVREDREWKDCERRERWEFWYFFLLFSFFS